MVSLWFTVYGIIKGSRLTSNGVVIGTQFIDFRKIKGYKLIKENGHKFLKKTRIELTVQGRRGTIVIPLSKNNTIVYNYLKQLLF